MNCSSTGFSNTKVNWPYLMLKEHVALDQTSWSIKSVYNRLVKDAYGW